MKSSYTDTGGNVREEIQLLNSISHVSARLARNLSILAATSKSEEGGKTNLGCTLDGIVRVKERCTHFGSDEHALIPAFKMTVKEA